VVYFKITLRLKPNQLHSVWSKVFDFLHFLVIESYFFSTQWEESTNLILVESMAGLLTNEL
jgi:hypothetical protein